MPSFDDVVASYLSNPGVAQTPAPVSVRKKEDVAAASAQKKSDLGAPQPLYNVAAARSLGTGAQAITDPVQNDLVTLNNWELVNKYGSDAARIISEFAGAEADYHSDKQTTQDTGDMLFDTASGAASGFLNAGLGIGAMGLGVVNDDLGAWASEKIGELNEWTQDKQSSALQSHRRSSAAENQALTGENAAQYGKDVKTDGKMIAGLKRIGRDAWDVVSNATEDPTMLMDGTSNAVGSLLAGGPIGKILKAGGSALAARFAVGATGPSRAGSMIAAAANKGSMPAAIGLMEGGGAYQQTAAQVMAMSHEELLAGSPEYAQLLEAGYAPDQARRELADSAGTEAAAIVAPVAGLTGTLVSKFEASPLRIPTSLGSAAGNAGREAIEEGIQSGVGAYAQNQGIQSYADQDQDLLEGVGEQAGTGALYGSMSAGGIQTPGAVARTAVDLTKAGFGKASAAIISRARKNQEAALSVSPVAAPVVQQAFEEAQAAQPELREMVSEALEEVPETETRDVILDTVDQVFAGSSFNDAMLEQPEYSNPLVKTVLTGSANQFDAISRLADLVDLIPEDNPDIIDAGFALHKILSDNTATIQQLAEVIGQLPEGHASTEKLSEYVEVMGRVGQMAKVQNLLAAVSNHLQANAEEYQTKDVEITPENVDSPEVQAELNYALSAAELAPETVNPIIAQKFLAQASSGNIRLTPFQTAVLKAAASLVEERRKAIAWGDTMDIRNPDIVSNQILADRKTKTSYPSAYEYMRRITQAYRLGDMEAATKHLQDLRDFAQHLQNKLTAMNTLVESPNQGKENKASFTARGPSGKWFKSETQFLNMGNESSVRLMQTVGHEARVIGNVYNQLAESFADLGGSPLSQADIHSELTKPTKKVVEDYRSSLAQAKPQEPEVVAPDQLPDEVQAKPEREVSAGAETEATTQTEQSDDAARGSSEVETTSDAHPDQAAQENQNETEEDLEGRGRDRSGDSSGSDRSDVSEVREEAQEAQPAEDSSDPRPESSVQEEVNGREVTFATPKVSEGKAKGIVSLFPEVGELFHTAFTIPEAIKSRLLGMGSVVEAIGSHLTSLGSFETYTDNYDVVGPSMTQEILDRYQQYLGTVFDTTMEQLDKQLQKAVKDVGENINKLGSFPKGKSFNIAERNEDGTYSYNQELIEGAVLAGMQWLLASHGARRSIDVEAASKILGIPEESVEDYMLDFLNAGMTIEEATNSLTQKIKSYWGLSDAKGALTGYADGIPQAVAKEIIVALEKQSLLRKNSRDFATSVGVKSYVNFSVFPNDEDGFVSPFLLEEKDSLKAFPDVFDRMILVDPERIYFFGDEKPRVSTHQLDNPLVELAPRQKEAQRVAQEQEHFVNPTMVAFYRALGSEGLKQIFTSSLTELPNKNVNFDRSLNGKVLSVTSAYESLEKQLQALEHFAGDQEVTSIPVRFAYEFTSVNRLAMQSPFNPQASKLVREAIMPTWATLDLSDRSSEHYGNFLIAIGQATGTKVERLTRQDAIDAVEAKLEGDFLPLVQMLQDWLTTDINSLSNGFSAKQIQTISDVLGDTPGFAAVNALIEYARLQNTEDRSAFRTPLYVEADGVTNGAMMAMKMLTSGDFNETWFKNMAKGGLLRGDHKTLAEQRASDKVDLYQTVTRILNGTLSEKLSDPDMSREQKSMLQAIVSIMDLLFGDDFTALRDERGNIIGAEIQRGIAKNPLTVIMYGSSPAGIANKFSGMILDEVYMRFSRAASANAGDSIALAMFGDIAGGDQTLAETYARRFQASLDLLTNKEYRKGKQGEYLANVKRKGQNTLLGRSFVDASLDTAGFDALTNNIRSLFVGPMVDAINETMAGNVLENTQLLKRATAIMSVWAKYEFRELVAKLVARKQEEGTGWKQSDGFTREEVRKLYKAVTDKLPYVTNGDQNLLVLKEAKSAFKLTELSRAFDNTLRTDPELRAPDNAGVAGIPYVVQGYGDGQTIIEWLTDAEKVPGTLEIYDGIHIPLDRLAEGSRKANEAAHKAWQGNPMRAVLEAFSSWLENVSDGEIFDYENIDQKAFAEELGDAFEGNRKSETLLSNSLEFQTSMQETLVKLKSVSESIDQRQETLAQTNLYVDQLAGIQQSFETNPEGIDLSDLDNEQAAELLNRMMRPEAEPEGSTEAESSERPLYGLGRQDSATGVVTLSRTALRNLVKAGNYSPEQRQMLRELLKSGNVNDTQVAVGSHDQLKAWADARGYAMPSNTGQDGEFSVQDNIAFIFDGNEETVLHELIHAATYAETVMWSQGMKLPGVAGTEKAKAFTRIEELMNEFLYLEPDFVESSDFYAAASVIDGHLRSPDKATGKAAAINEFMAYALSNQNLIEMGKAKSANPLIQLLGKALDAIKLIVFGSRRVSKDQSNLFEALRFNTSIVLSKSPPSRMSVFEGVRLYHRRSNAQPTNERLEKIQSTITNKILRYVGNTSDRVTKEWRKDAITEAELNAIKLTHNVEANGFPMTTEERHTFQWLTQILMSGIQMDPLALNKVQDIFTHAIKTLKVSHFVGDNPTQDEQYYAQQMLDVLRGNYLVGKDRNNRSTLLPVFLGLSVVSEDLRQALAKLPMPKGEKNTEQTLDALLENTGNLILDNVSEALSGERGSKDVQQALDKLTDRLMLVAEDQKSQFDLMTDKAGNMLDSVNAFFADGVDKVSSKLETQGKKMQDPAKSKLMQQMGKATESIGSLLSSENSDTIVEGALGVLNRSDKLWTPLFETLVEMIGRTKSNAELYDMVKRVRGWVQQQRQQYREHVPEIISKKFSRKLKDHEWTAMFHALAKTDIGSLVTSGKMLRDDALKVLTDSSFLGSKVADLEAQLQSEDRVNWKLIQQKAKELAHFMNTGEVPHMLLRNAHAVAGLYLPGFEKRGTPSNQLVSITTQLISLYAVQGLEKPTLDTISLLIAEQPEGMKFVYGYLADQRKAEARLVSRGAARINHFKGFIPSEPTAGRSLVVAELGSIEETQLLTKGYVFAGKYKGSYGEAGRTKAKGYYYAPVPPRNPFSQGILQNVRPTGGGVDLVTGHTSSHAVMTAGRIDDQVAVDQITKRIAMGDFGHEKLMPIFGEDRKIVAYERSVDPKISAKLGYSSHLGNMLGAWHGRRIEEDQAHAFNRATIRAVKKMYDEDIKKSPAAAGGYVDVFSRQAQKDDPVLADAVALIPFPTRELIRESFGDYRFMVRKDMLNQVLGYRSAGVADMWTGTSRIPENVRDAVKTCVTAAFGTKAYPYLVNGEKILSSFVADAKRTIVVKSVFVPLSNIYSNLMQLIGRGVPIKNIVTGFPKKVSEVRNYINTRQRLIEAEAELTAVENDPRESRRLKAEIQSIKDSHRRLSIWPLIENGEFTSISDLDIREDIGFASGKLTDAVDSWVDKLPESVRNAGRYAWISRDTALYKGLQRTVEYGDFVAKALIYDDMVNRHDMSTEEALGKVTEEYVNFDIISGRTGAYLDTIGLSWFWKFKLRSTKIALSMIRNNPVHALFAGLLPAPEIFGNIGSPITDNAVGVIASGEAGYSLGIGQGFRAPALHPWMQLMS